VPNGYEEERDRVWRASRFWGMVWQVGDAAYYLGLLGSAVLPLVFLAIGIYRFETWGLLLRRAALSVGLFLRCFPVGMIACAVLKGVSEQGAGVK